MESTFEPLGLYRARRELDKKYPGWKVANLVGLMFIHHESSGRALSPLCTGEGPAIRFAALLVSRHHGDWFDDERLVDTQTGAFYYQPEYKPYFAQTGGS